MEAKETIMSDTNLWQVMLEGLKKTDPTHRKEITDSQIINKAIAQAQAEITWKARDPEIAEAYKEGRREVVDFMQNNFEEDQYGCRMFIDIERWQAKLKIWFKDNPELLKEWGL